MPKIRDVTGNVYGRLTAVEWAGRLYGKVAWRCRCDCGNEVVLPLTALVSGNTRSCGCYKRSAGNHTNKSDLDGQRFARLLVVGWAGSTKDGQSEWACRCDCGADVVVVRQKLVSGNTRSCGCLKVQEFVERLTKHGMSRSAEYGRWTNIKQRCLNPNNSRWVDYGGRGITLYGPWAESFAAFFADVGSPPSPDLTLDRIDNNRGYEPGNVRWSTAKEQVANRRPRATHVEVDALKAENEALRAIIAQH